MSKPSLARREQQQSSPFGLGHKQAKKYGANAPQLRAIRCYIDFCVILCNETALNPVRSWLLGLFCYVPLHNSWYRLPYFSCVARATRPLAHAATPGVELTLPKPLAFAKGQKQPQVL